MMIRSTKFRIYMTVLIMAIACFTVYFSLLTAARGGYFLEVVLCLIVGGVCIIIAAIPGRGSA
ncbi:MAG: hypothetical protein KAV45_00385 [Calditrichia bacterium]|jgi:hypothetical protein|nr:hypothetical protein [Calditrichia bacterium]